MDQNQTKKENIKIYDCIIIGGGISGISFAHYLAQDGKKILVTEKSGSVGGQIQTSYIEGEHSHWGELGAHTCYNSYTNLLSIVKQIKSENLIQPLDKFNYVVHTKGKIKSIMSEVSILSCAIRFPKIFFANKTNKTAREYFSPIVGRYNYDHLFTNAFKAVISQNADDYPAEIFLKRRNEKDKSLPRRFTFSRGLSSLIEAIVQKDRLVIQTNCEVIKIEKDGNNNFALTCRNGETLYTSNIAIATDPQTCAHLLTNCEHSVASLLSDISLFESETLDVVLLKNKVSIKSIAGIIPLHDTFLSAVSRDLIKDENLRSFAFHFEKGKLNDEEKLTTVCKTLNISPNDIIDIKTASHTLPSLRVRHLHMNKKVDEVRSDKNIYLLGNYYYGLSLEDCVIRSKEEYNRFAKNNIK